MKMSLKKLIFTGSVTGSIFSFCIMPSYGGKIDQILEEEGDKKSSNKIGSQLRGNYDLEIISCSRIEQKIKEKDLNPALESSLRNVAVSFFQSGYNIKSLTFKHVELWVEGAVQGHFSALYNLGWLLHQKREKEDTWDKEIIETLQRVENKEKEMHSSVLEESRKFYLSLCKNCLEDQGREDKLGKLDNKGLEGKQDLKKGQTYLEYLKEIKAEVEHKRIENERKRIEEEERKANEAKKKALEEVERKRIDSEHFKREKVEDLSIEDEKKHLEEKLLKDIEAKKAIENTVVN